MTISAQLTSTQKGKVTEQLVASALLIASNGRLAPFVPLADDHGLDLIVLDKATRMALAASWLIPMAIVPDVSTEQPEKYALVPSLKATAKDRCRPYRHDDAHALVTAILRVLDGS